MTTTIIALGLCLIFWKVYFFEGFPSSKTLLPNFRFKVFIRSILIILSKQMTKIKIVLLALCIGIVAAVLYDTSYPQYKYYNSYKDYYTSYNKEVTKEVLFEAGRASRCQQSKTNKCLCVYNRRCSNNSVYNYRSTKSKA